jgi:hypothetical protein
MCVLLSGDDEIADDFQSTISDWKSPENIGQED